jgi:hypothetical protein
MKTPVKSVEGTGCSKPLDDTSTKEPIKEGRRERTGEEQAGHQVGLGFMESENCLNSLVNLNMSLKKLSVNNFDSLVEREDDEISLAENIT